MAKSKAPMTKKNNFEKKTPEHKVKTEGKINKGKKDVKMSKKPVAKAVHIANSKARMAIGAGEVTEAEKARKQEQDERTLYIRFTGDKLPSAKEVKELHSDIKFVRTPRTAGKLKDNEAVFKYAFLEFSNEDECTKAKNKLATTRFHGSELYLDYVGEKSKCQKKADKPQQLNPLRLFVCGLEPGVKKATLKEMFPKCSHAEIPSQSAKKGTPYGFVQFSNPGDAKSAFDAAQNLDIAGYKITVLYAKVSENKEEILAFRAVIHAKK
jgi:RNA recognition motif-containing protein